MKSCKFKWIMLLCISAMLLSVLSACISGGSAGNPSESESETDILHASQAVTTAVADKNDPQKEEKTTMLTTNSKALLYFNDSGHIANESPYNPTRSSIVTKSRLEASVKEATDAGCDVFLSEIYGMVPWYPSNVYSVEEHLNWFYNEFGGSGSNGFLTFTKNGNDYLQIQLDKTHEANKLFFFSYRLNDLHGLAQGLDPSTASVLWISKFFIEHPEYRIGETRANNGSARYMLDYRFEAVRNYKLSMIRELIENYDLDGIVLDFLRAPAYFNLVQTTSEQRENIMTEFVADVKAILDEKTAQTGKEYYFGVTLPIEDTIYDEMGVNVDRLCAEAGVEMIVFWDYYHTVQNFALLDQFKTAHPSLLAYAMVSQAVSYLPDANPAVVRYATDEQLYTTAYLAYLHKADGISLFNMAFYRNWQFSAGTKGFYEPPFNILFHLKDPEFLKTAPQYYFLGYHYNLGRYSFNLRDTTLSKSNPTMTFRMDTYAPDVGYTKDGLLILEGVSDISEKNLTVKLNGVVLPATTFKGFAYESPYTQLIGSVEQIKCFSVDRDLLDDGINTFEVSCTFTGNETLKFQFISLTIQ